jgi:hypothetical protein
VSRKYWISFCFNIFSTIRGICADHLMELYLLGFHISLLSLIFDKIQPYFGLILHVSIFMYDVTRTSRNVLEVIAVIRNIMGSCTDYLFQHALAKSLQRLDKAGLEIKERQYEASSSVVRNNNYKSKRRCVSVLSYNNSKNLCYCPILSDTFFRGVVAYFFRIFYSLLRRGAQRNILHSRYIFLIGY